MKNRNPFHFGATLTTLSVAMTLGTQAASNTWVGDTNVWDTATTPNWTSPTTWTSGDDAVFGDPGAGGLTLALTTVSAHNIDFNTTGYAITGSTLTLTGSTPTITTATGVSASISSSIAGTAGLTKAGAGDLLLTGTTPYSGNTAINQGTLTFKAPSNAAWTIGGGTKTIASGTTMKVGVSPQTSQYVGASIGTTVINGTLNLSGTIANTSGHYQITNLTASGAGNIDITDGGSFVLNFSGALNGFTGAVNITGTSQLTLQGGTTSSTGTYSVDIASGSKFDLRTEGHTIGALNGSGQVIKSHNGVPGTGLFTIGNGNGSGDFSGNMTAPSTSYNLVKTGTGTQILSGSLSYPGTTTVNGGTLIINGTSTNSAFTVASTGTLAGAGSIGSSGKNVTVSSGGFLAPGSAAGASIGTLTVNSTLTLAAGSKTTCELQKAGATRTNDQLFVNAVTYGGTLEVTASGDPLEADDEFFLFDSLAYSGSFGTITLPTLPEGLAWNTTRLGIDGSIKVTNLALTPVFDLADGNYIGAQNVTMTSESGSTVYYTFAMGSVPPDPTLASASGTVGSGTATVNLPTNGQWNVKAFATKPGLGNSLVALATYDLIDVPVWINTAGGYWSDFPEDAANWQGGVVAEGSGIPADFSTLALGGDTTVTLDGDRTIGSLIFGDTGNQFDWLLDRITNSTLTLAGPTPSIAVNNRSATVNTPLAGTGGLVKTGAGDLVLSGANTYTGATTVNGGALIISPTTAGNSTLNATTYSVSNASKLRFDLTNVGGTGFPTLSKGAVSTVSGATVELYSTNAVHDGSATNSIIINSGAFSGAGNLNKEGNGAITMNFTGALAGFTGTLNVNNGTLALQGGNTSTVGDFAVNVASGAFLDIRTDSQNIGGLNGSGSVIKSHNGFGGTLTIGSGDGNGDFSGTMTGQPTPYHLVKAGSGTQILGGALSYPGTTTVNGGTLVINGASTNSNFTVATTGILGGSGSIGGTVTVDPGGTLAPGQSIGTLTLAAATLNGTYQCDLGASTSDKVVVTGTLTVGGTAAITFTGTPVAASYIIASYGTLTGTLPTITPPEGYTLVNDTTAKQIKLVAAGGFQSWMDAWVTAGFSGSTAAGADPENDGMKNLMEYVLNGNPGASDLTLLPQLQMTTTDFVFTFTRRVDSATDTVQVFEYGSTLAGWTPVNITGTPGAGVAIGAATGTAPNEVQTVTVTIPRSAEGNGKLFGRLQVTQP